MNKSRTILAAVFLLGLAGLPVLADQAAERELEFAAALISMGFPDYAEKLTNELLKQDPSLKDKAQSLKINILIAYRKFAEAEALVKAMPKNDPQAQEKWRAIATGYLQAKDMENAKRIYKEILGQSPEEAIQAAGTNNTFMLEAAYRMAQLLERSGDYDGAIKAYDRLVQITDKSDVTLLSKLQCAEANLYLKSAQGQTGAAQSNALESAKKMCNNVVWRGVDLYFCQAVIILVQIDLINGKRAVARKKVMDNTPTFQKIDEFLRKQKDEDKIPLSVSPLAAGYYFLGRIDQEDGEDLIEKSKAAAPEAPGEKAPEPAKAATPEPAKPKAAEPAKPPAPPPAKAPEPAKGKTSETAKAKAAEPAKPVAPPPAKAKAPEPAKPKAPELTPEQYREKGIALLLQALKELNYVTANYRESEWAPDAALRAQSVREKLKELGKEVPEEKGAAPAAAAPGAVVAAQSGAATAQVKAADNLFYNQTNYPKAQDEYLAVLAGYPDSTNTPRILKNLAVCYLNQQDNLMVKATAQYLAERFAGNFQAGIMLLQIGRACNERKDLDMLAFVYATFLDNFPRHDNAAAVLFSMAMIRKKKGDESGSIKMMQRILDEYPNDPSSVKAYEQVAWWRFKEKKYDEAAKYFKKFIAENRDAKLKPPAQFGLANCYLSQEKFGDALNEFKPLKADLEKRLAEKDNTLTPAQLKQYRELLEQASYLTAFCLSRVDQPAEAVPGYKDEAIALAGKFIKDYTNSTWAPKIMSLRGTLQLDRGQIDPAVETFNKLAELYPQSPEGNNALVSLVQAALAVKKNDVARDALEKMKANKEFYLSQGKEATFAYIGRLMFDAGQYPQAIAAYQIVTASATTNKDLLENSFFYLGRACCETGNYPDAVAALNTLLTRYPTSAFYYDAKFLLSRAYRGLKQYKEVYDSLNDIATRSTNMVFINKASLELSKAQLDEGKPREALASLMRVSMLADAKNPELRPMVEEALLESLKLQRDMNSRQDIIDTCNQYLAKFPEGAKAAEVQKIKREAEAQAGAPAP